MQQPYKENSEDIAEIFVIYRKITNKLSKRRFVLRKLGVDNHIL